MDKAVRSVFPAVALLLSAIFIYFILNTLHWPLMHDAPLMQYSAWKLIHGGVPYRDLYDFNLPGSYFIHWINIRIFGGSDLAWRMTDTFFMLLAIIGFIRLLPQNKWMGCCAGIIFSLYHLGWGIPSMGQRDFFMAVFLLLSSAEFLRSLSGGSKRSIWIAAIWSGVALSIKPTAAFFILLQGAWMLGAALQQKKELRKVIRELAIYAAGVLLVMLPVIGWLWWTGGLPYLADILANYIGPVHANDEPMSAERMAGLVVRYFPLIIPAVIIFAMMLFLRRKPANGLGFLICGIGFGFFHFFFQRKGWDYHLYPLAIFLFAGFFFAADRLAASAKEKIFAGAAVLAIAVMPVLSARKALLLAETTYEYKDYERMRKLEQSLRNAGVTASDKIQVFDTVGGGVNLLYRLGIHQPTRFMYDFVFMHSGIPYVEGLKKQFMDQMIAGKPLYIICWNNGWLGPDLLSDRMGMIPGFNEFVAGNYEKDALSDWRITVYKRLPASSI